MEIISKNPLKIVGTLCPSSPYLAYAMVNIDNFSKAKMNILEIGGGTGAITKKIIKKLHNEQSLDIIEIMPSFAKILNAKFSNLPNVNIINKDIRQFETEKKYDLIFSALPFNAFPSTVLKQVLNKILELSTFDTKMAFFEYKWSRALTPLWIGKKAREDFYISRQIIDNFINDHSYEKRSVDLNIPPAFVYYLSLNKKG